MTMAEATAAVFVLGRAGMTRATFLSPASGSTGREAATSMLLEGDQGFSAAPGPQSLWFFSRRGGTGVCSLSPVSVSH